jgi:hypothetical protein
MMPLPEAVFFVEASTDFSVKCPHTQTRWALRFPKEPPLFAAYPKATWISPEALAQEYRTEYIES